MDNNTRNNVLTDMLKKNIIKVRESQPYCQSISFGDTIRIDDDSGKIYKKFHNQKLN